MILLHTLLFAFGVFLMIYGADRLVEGGSAIAVHFRISPLVIGLTVVSFGTSFPEFAASLVSALQGKTDLAMGNVIGSNICNLGLVLGAAALTRPIEVEAGLIRKEVPFLLLISGLTWFLSRDNRIGRGEGLLLFALFLLFVYYCIRTARRRDDALPKGLPPVKTVPLPRSLFRLLFGLVLLFAGAELTIRSVVSISQQLGIDQAVIGLTVVALGTSLPELATSVVALRKGEGEIGLGNVLGSNIFNLLFVLGVTASVHPIPSSSRFPAIDIPVMLGFTLLLIPFAGSRLRISRREGGLLLTAYGGYLLYLVLRLA